MVLPFQLIGLLAIIKYYLEELKKQKFTDIESKHPDIFNFIFKKNNENKELLLEFKDIRNEKVNITPLNLFFKRLEFNI